MAVTTQQRWRHGRRNRLAAIRLKIKAVINKIKKIAAINKINMAAMYRRLKVLIGEITVDMTEEPNILSILDCLSMILRLKKIPTKSDPCKIMIRHFIKMLVTHKIVDNSLNENNVINYFHKNLGKIIEECDKQIGSCKIPICTEENIYGKCCNLLYILHDIKRSINNLRVQLTTYASNQLTTYAS